MERSLNYIDTASLLKKFKSKNKKTLIFKFIILYFSFEDT